MKDLRGQEALALIRELESKDDATVLFSGRKYVDIAAVESFVSYNSLMELYKNKQITIVEFWNNGKYDYILKTL